MAEFAEPEVLQRRQYIASAISCGLLAIGVIFLCWHKILVPEKMTYDSHMIQDIATGRLAVLPGDKSYGNTGALYRTLGLAYQPMLASILGFSIYFVLLSGVVSRLARYRVNLLDGAILVAATALGGIFLGQYSKDVMVTLLVLFAFRAGRSWTAEFAFIACALIYATYFRQYWYLVMAFYIALRIIQSRSRRVLTLLLACAAGLAVLALVFPILAHADVQSFRTDANATRVGSADAQTMIMPLLPGSSPVIGAANTLITFVELLLPVPMLLMSATHAVYGIFLMTIWICFLVGVKRGARMADAPIAWARCSTLALAMVCVQAIFEPDYGSYLRHLTPMLPVMVYVAAVPRLRGTIMNRKSR